MKNAYIPKGDKVFKDLFATIRKNPIIYLETRVHWDPSLYEYGIITSGYPKLANGNRTLEILVEHFNDTYSMADGPFNFSMYNTQGYIMYWLYYDSVVPGHSLEIQITDRL